MSKKKSKKIKKSLPIEVIDAVPEVIVPIPVGKNASQIAKLNNPALNYFNTRGIGRGRFHSPEYDLAESGRVEDTESMIRQAFDKKVALMFKEGFALIGKNPRTVKYIRIRLAQIARASGMPTLQMLRELGSSLIRKSNSFLLKVRNIDASGGKLRTLPGSTTELKPVAGYFPLPAETMEASFTSKNKLAKWRQRMPDSQYVEFSPNDVIHFYYDRKDGFLFGTPTIIPVIDDVRALRKIEENIELLIYQHLFPLFHWKVGTELQPAGMDEKGQDEISVVKAEIQYMPTEGGIVTSHRHEVEAIGAQDRALDAEKYLKHFQQRVISGLGISAVDLGNGDTTNRATSDNMSRNLIDSVKDFQQVMEVFFNEHVISELLLESTFGPEVLDEQNMVYLQFNEIDIDSQIKLEAHSADQFDKHLITQDEARLRIGKEPLKIPTQEEAAEEEDLSVAFPDWHRTFFKLIQEPIELIKATKTSNSPAGQAAAANPNTSVSPEHNEEANTAQNEQQKELEKIKGDAKVAAARATARARPKARDQVIQADSFLSEVFSEIKRDILDRLEFYHSTDIEWINQKIRAQLASVIDYMVANQMVLFRNGYQSIRSTSTSSFVNASSKVRIEFRERANRYVQRLTNDLVRSLRSVMSRHDSPSASLKAECVDCFSVLEYRPRFIEDVELKKAKMVGKIAALKDAGITDIKIQKSQDSCDTCRNNTIQNSISLASGLIFDDIPPYHANCHCSLLLGNSGK